MRFDVSIYHNKEASWDNYSVKSRFARNFLRTIFQNQKEKSMEQQK